MMEEILGKEVLIQVRLLKSSQKKFWRNFLHLIHGG